MNVKRKNVAEEEGGGGGGDSGGGGDVPREDGKQRLEEKRFVSNLAEELGNKKKNPSGTNF